MLDPNDSWCWKVGGWRTKRIVCVRSGGFGSLRMGANLASLPLVLFILLLAQMPPLALVGFLPVGFWWGEERERGKDRYVYRWNEDML